MAIPKKLKRIEPGIFKVEGNKWLVDCRADGRGTKRIRKIHDTLQEARITKKGMLG